MHDRYETNVFDFDIFVKKTRAEKKEKKKEKMTSFPLNVSEFFLCSDVDIEIHMCDCFVKSISATILLALSDSSSLTVVNSQEFRRVAHKVSSSAC